MGDIDVIEFGRWRMAASLPIWSTARRVVTVVSCPYLLNMCCKIEKRHLDGVRVRVYEKGVSLDYGLLLEYDKK
jgi:hypothetical protein